MPFSFDQIRLEYTIFLASDIEGLLCISYDINHKLHKTRNLISVKIVNMHASRKSTIMTVEVTCLEIE